MQSLELLGQDHLVCTDILCVGAPNPVDQMSALLKQKPLLLLLLCLSLLLCHNAILDNFEDDRTKLKHLLMLDFKTLHLQLSVRLVRL